jgi:peptidoglycan hydrolase CwlO-like protein
MVEQVEIARLESEIREKRKALQSRMRATHNTPS